MPVPVPDILSNSYSVSCRMVALEKKKVEEKILRIVSK